MRLINRNKGNRDAPKRAELYNSFITDSSCGCLIFDSELCLLEINAAAQKILNIKQPRTAGSDIREMMPNMERSGRYELLEEVINSGKSVQFKEYLLRPGHENGLFEIAAFRLGKGLGVIVCDTRHSDVGKVVGLANESETLRAIESVIHEPFLVLDSRNHVMNANQAFYSHFGYKPQAVLGEPIFELGESQWNVSDLHELLEHKLSQTGSVKNFQITCYFGGLGERTLILNASKYYLESENHLLTFLAIRDTTDLANQRATLQKLSDIYINSPDPILITDLEGLIVDVNEEAVNLYGWSRSDLVGKSFKTIIPPDARDLYDNLLQTVLAAGQVKDVEVEHWSKNGGILPINLNVHLLKNSAGDRIGTVTYIRHIASQSQAEKSIKRYYTVLMNSNDPVVVLDMNGIIVEINDAAETTYAWAKGSIIGKSGTVLISKEDQKNYLAKIADCFTGKTIRQQNICCLTKQGVTRNAQISMYLLTDAKNESHGIAIVAKHTSDTEKTSRAYQKLIKGFMAIEDPIIVENMMGEVVDLNSAAATAYGWKKSDLVGKLAKLLIPVDQQKQTSELIQMCKNGKVIKNQESKRWSKSGVFFPVRLTMFQVTDSENVPQNIVTISRHIVSGDSAIAGSGGINMESLFRDHVDSIIIEDLSGNVLEMNHAASKMLGWNPIDLKGKPIKTIIPADQHKQHEKILLLCQNNVPIHKVESKRWSKTGKVFPVSVSLVLLKDGEGRPSSVASITWDISDVKKLELQERTLKKQLGQH